jgi:hypothetical protein
MYENRPFILVLSLEIFFCIQIEANCWYVHGTKEGGTNLIISITCVTGMYVIPA